MELRPYQIDFVTAVAKSFAVGHKRLLGVLPTGGGKCLGQGTPVLMFDGSVKAVEEVVAGDLLAGPDAYPRTVTATTSGKEAMFTIRPKKGDEWRCNASHILSLKISGNSEAVYHDGRKYAGGDIANIECRSLLAASKTFLHREKLWRSPVDFPEQTLPLDPWMLGVWLGDGASRHPNISNPDDEILHGVHSWCAANGAVLNVAENTEKCRRLDISGLTRKHGANPLIVALRNLGLFQNKHIPQPYLTSSRHQRLELLAGLIDTDGHHDGRNGIQFTSVTKNLADGVTFIARSLGLAAYQKSAVKSCQTGTVGEYYLVSISGDTDMIPCRVTRKRCAPRKQKKNALFTGFSIIAEPVGDYFGFEIDGPDRLFLLGDFTVTHNTICFAKIAQRFLVRRNERTLILAHREELITQAADKVFAATGIVASIEKARSFADHDAKVVVASIQTLQGERLLSWPQDHFGLIVVDEAHHVLAESYLKTLAHFDTRVLGVTATPDRGDRKNLSKYFDHLAYETNLLDLIAQKFLSPIVVKSVPIKIDISEVKQTAGDLDSTQLDSAIAPYLKAIAKFIAENCADRKKIVAFLPLIATSQRFVAECQAAGLSATHVDGMSKDRKQILADFSAGKFQVISNAMLLTEGWDEPGVDCVVFLRPTKSRALYAQAVGRGTRLAEGKENLLLLDFLWMHARHDLAKPASLVAKDKDEEDQITAALKDDKDLSEAVTDAANNAAAEREAALIRELAAYAAKEERNIPIESVGALLLKNYKANAAWEGKPVSPAQRNVLTRFGLKCNNAGEASAVMNRLFERSKGKLATPKQLTWLIRLKHPSPETATNAEAKAFLDGKWKLTN